MLGVESLGAVHDDDGGISTGITHHEGTDKA